MLLAEPSGGDVASARPTTGSDPADRHWDRPAWAAPSAGDVEAPLGNASGGRVGRTVVVAGVLVVAVLLLSVVTAIEVYGRRQLTDTVAAQLRSSGVTGTIEVSTAGGPRPVILAMLLGRGLDDLQITITDGTIAGLPVARADYRLSGISGSVSARTGAMHVESIRSGKVRIDVDPDAISAAVGTDLKIVDGRLLAGPDDLVVRTAIADGSLVLSGDAEALWGGPVQIPVADGYLLPCTPSVHIGVSTLVLACSGADLPGVLRDPLGATVDSGSTSPGSLVPPQSTVMDRDTTQPAVDGSGSGSPGAGEPVANESPSATVPSDSTAATTVPPLPSEPTAPPAAPEPPPTTPGG